MTILVGWFGVEKLTRLKLEEELKLNPISIDGRKMIKSPAILRPVKYLEIVYRIYISLSLSLSLYASAKSAILNWQSSSLKRRARSPR
jgi:hypothetical protein